MTSEKQAYTPVVQRLLTELISLLRLTGYFYVAFIAIAFYRATVLKTYGFLDVVWGPAFVKAVLMAKFLMIGQSMKFGKINGRTVLIKPIFFRSVGLLVVLVVLTAIEQTVSGLFRHRTFSVISHELSANGGEKVAEIFILLLVLIPFVAFSVFEDALGKERFHGMLFRRATARAPDERQASG